MRWWSSFVLPRSQDWEQARAWQPVQSRLMAVKLNGRSVHRRRFCFTISARYQYEFDGASYIGTRIETDDSRWVTGEAGYRPDFGSGSMRWAGYSAACPCFWA